MEIQSAKFVGSFPGEKQCPSGGRPEFAFIGRSNVGKSSLINMLTGRKALAKVSSTPGKTRLINFFEIDHSWYLVDLPGYGYARVPKTEQRQLAQRIEDYLLHRQTLLLAFVLIDSNVPPQDHDLNFINNLGAHRIPFAVVFTKCDRLSKNQLSKNTTAFLNELMKNWQTLPPHFMTSSMHRTGRAEVLQYIEQILKQAKI